jgi:NTP pyrophosphatase (non-canonical NTP hydrolase)
MNKNFRNTINALCQAAYDNSRLKGFHGPYGAVEEMYENEGLSNTRRSTLINHLDQACMARIMGEVGEAVEAMRHGNPASEKIPSHSHVEEELADTLIRIFDYCGMKGYDLGGAVVAKMEHNSGRPFLHGKNS